MQKLTNNEIEYIVETLKEEMKRAETNKERNFIHDLIEKLTDSNK